MRQELQKAFEDAFDEGVDYVHTQNVVLPPRTQQEAREAHVMKALDLLAPVIKAALVAAYEKGGPCESPSETRWWAEKHAELVLK